MNTKLSKCCEKCKTDFDTKTCPCLCHTEESTEKKCKHGECIPEEGLHITPGCFCKEEDWENWNKDLAKLIDEDRYLSHVDTSSVGKLNVLFHQQIQQAVKEEREKLATQIFGLDDIFYDEEPGAMIKKDDVIGIINKE